MPERPKPLICAGEPITPLIPLKPLLLNYFTPEELIQRLTFRRLLPPEDAQVEVSLRLTLSGPNHLDSPKDYHVTKIYPLEQKNVLTAIPVLEIWPNLKLKTGEHTIVATSI